MKFNSSDADQILGKTMYRFHIDIPLTKDELASKEISAAIVEYLKNMKITEVELIQYRLGNDNDRGNKNYLDIDENGHCSNKKIKITS